MCDTFVALPDATVDGSVIFGKNSDRPAGEIQDVVTFGTEGRVRSALRSSASLSLCQLHQGKFAIDTAKSIFRDHQGHICMHGEFETRGSQISKLSAQQGEHWFIDRPFPCQQKYKLIAFPTTTERKHQPMAVNP